MLKIVKKACTPVRRGFTFLEVILYLALATIIVGVLFSYGWNMVGARVKFNTLNETQSAARLISERINEAIRGAQTVNTEQSVFDAAPGKLVLNSAGEDIVLEIIDDKLAITRGANSPQFLHSNKVRIRNFQLSKQESGEGKIQYVGFDFVAEAFYPEAGNRQEYKFDLPYSSGSELRVR